MFKNPFPSLAGGVFLAVVCGSPAFGAALNLADQTASYASLPNTVATLTGRSELHLTNGGDPFPGSTISLNSPDSWLYFPAVKPSQVAASLLAKVRVNGAAAALGGNIRVVQFEEGAVVIPHAPGFQPMEVFDGRNFTGPSKKLGQYLKYDDRALGALKSAIGSFTLKHGYMATLAQNEDGTGASKVYIAQDGDLEIAVLPAAFDNRIRFVRIFPWRWVGKKGICGDIEQALNVKWMYNWSISRTSPLDWEYVPIKQTRWWPGLGEDWKYRGATHILGFNEPDRPDQANMTVDEAIAGWPELESTGLRIGAPAVADPNVRWIDDFMTKANAQGLRVDFVPVHFYRGWGNQNDPGGAAWQIQQALIDLHNRVQRPLWVTEWNNGANWTSQPDPNFQQQAAMVRAMSDMLDSLDFVERYSLFNWVEDVRRVVWDDGSLTEAGVVYRDNVAPAAYSQEIPDAGLRTPADYLFEGDFHDSSGNGNGAIVHGSPKFVAARGGIAASFDGAADWLQLPPNAGDSADFSFAAWVKWSGGGNWQRVFDFGSSLTRNVFLTPKSGDGTLRFAIQNNNTQQRLEAPPLAPGVWTHVAVILSGNTGKLFVNGVLANSNTGMTTNPSDVDSQANYLGKSRFADPLFNGQLEEARFFDRALSDAQVAGLAASPGPRFADHPLVGIAATPSLPYRATLANEFSGGSGVSRFEKIGGPSWLSVAPDGTLGGVPASADAGPNDFLIRVTDAAGNTDTAGLQIQVAPGAGLVARYAFDGNANSKVGGAHATTSGGPGYIAGRQAQAIDLDGADDFVNVPPAVVRSAEITLAAWVWWDGGAAWQRLFDFGNGTGEHFFLSPRSGSNRALFLIRKDGMESSVDAAMLPANQWVHVAATIGSGSMKLYIGGVLTGSAATGLTPADIAPMQNYLGKSQYPDPAFNGRIDEFLIFNRALGPAEIVALKNDTPPAFNTAAIVKPAGVIGQIYEQTVSGSATAAALVFSKVSGPDWLSVGANGRLSGIPGAADAGICNFVLRVTDSAAVADEAALKIAVNGAAGLLAHFAFDGNPSDSQGGAAGVTAGGPGYQTAAFDKAIQLDGADDSVTLRSGIVNGLNDVTIAARVFWNGGANWQRIFDFGNNTSQYIVLSPSSGGGTLRFTISTNGNAAGAEQQLNAPPLPIGEWSHVAVTLSGDVGTMFVNGVAVATGPISLNPSSLNPVKNYIGKSQFPDPLFNGLMDDFRIYDHALAAAEIRNLANPPPAIVVPDPGYEAWAAGFALPPGQEAAIADPDADGIPNLLEWLLGTDPKTASTAALPQAAVVSAAQLGLADGNRYLTLTARVRKIRPGTTLVPQASATLADLDSGAANVLTATPPVADGDFEILTWYCNMPVGNPDKAFMRLKVLKD